MNTNTSSYSLVILAGGLGSRFGGDKQLAELPGLNKTIMEISINDAYQAGIRHLVLIIRKELRALLVEQLLPRLPEDLIVDFAIQPRPNQIKELATERTKPLGTGHALLCAKPFLSRPFVVITADDYYGKSAFTQLLSDWQPENHWRMLGYPLQQTLSEKGGVNRGICKLNNHHRLSKVTEVLNINTDLTGETVDGNQIQLDISSLASMSLWALSTEFLTLLEQGFSTFVAELASQPTAEYFLPDQVQFAIDNNQQSVEVIPAKDNWYGVTYQEDLNLVAEKIAQYYP